MMALNASSLAKGQQWRNDLIMKVSEQSPNQNPLKDPNAGLQQNQIVASTVCCSQSNCNKVKLESMPERFFAREPGYMTTLTPDTRESRKSRDPPAGKKEGQAHTPTDPYMPYCPCVMKGGRLVTYCCMRRDCDEATKIGEVKPQQQHDCKSFKY